MDIQLINIGFGNIVSANSSSSQQEEIELGINVGTIDGDIIEVEGTNKLIFAGDSSDLIDASVGEGGNRIYAGGADDLIVLGEGDRVLGGLGDDRFFVTSGGNNTITGGAGFDEFWIASAEFPDALNMITDFTSDEDVIGIAGLGIGFADLSLTQIGNDVLISIGNDDLAVLQSVNVTELNEGNVVFDNGGTETIDADASTDEGSDPLFSDCDPNCDPNEDVFNITSFNILGPTGTTDDNTPLITWEASDTDTSYDLAISSTSNCANPELIFENLSDLSGDVQSFDVPFELDQGPYSICVTARNDDGSVNALNNGLTFFVDSDADENVDEDLEFEITPPSSFNILGPTGTIDDNTPLITWEKADNGDSYDLIIASDSDCANPELIFENLSGLSGDVQSFDVPFELDQGPHSICVTALNDEGSVNASNNGLTFFVDLDLDSVDLIEEPIIQ